MRIAFTEEQELLRAAARELCESDASTERLRELEDDPLGFDEQFWAQLGQMDLLGLTIPEAFGGSGMGPLEQVVLGEEFGRALAPSPHFVSSVVSAGLLHHAGSPAQQEQWLTAIANGGTIVSLAWHEAEAGDGPEGVRTTVAEDSGELVIDGTKIIVPYANSADALLVLARRSEQVDDIDLLLVSTDAPGVSMAQTMTMGSDSSWQVRFSGVRVPVQERLGAAGEGWSTFLAGMQMPLVVAAAWAVGAGERVHELATAYAKEREQFGVPVGHFQGIAHPLANTATQIAGARTLVYRAATSLSAPGGAGPLPAMAKRFATETWRQATRVAHQVYGGIGYTRAIDVQLYFRRAKHHDLVWFGPAFLDEVVAAAELDAAEPFVDLEP